jgi:hypothetical protein
MIPVDDVLLDGFLCVHSVDHIRFVLVFKALRCACSRGLQRSSSLQQHSPFWYSIQCLNGESKTGSLSGLPFEISRIRPIPQDSYCGRELTMARQLRSSEAQLS